MKKIEIFFRNILLWILLHTRKNANQVDPPVINKDSRILFVRLNRIGDALVTTPLLKSIKEQIGCRIYILAASQNYFVFENSNLSDEIIVYRKNVHGVRALIGIINGLNCDVIVDLHDDVSTTVSYLIAYSNCRYKFGLKKKNYKLFTHVVEKRDPSRYHVVDRIMEFSKLFHLKSEEEKINVVFQPKAISIKAASEFLSNRFPVGKFLVGINISAGSEARFWGIAKFRQLISDLSPYNINILLLCSEKDLNSASQIAGNGLPIYYRPTFDEFCAVIPFLDFLITPDTSIIHVASAFKIPMFGLYVHYNTNELIWSPYKSEFECVLTREPTLKNISNEDVKRKLLPLFEKFYFNKEKYGSKYSGL
ncbi:MAG: glycosyltransferase family 9 protein [Melioribacteraceae bacterium]